MELGRYRAIRAELCQLWEQLRFRRYRMIFPRAALYSLEGLENVERRSFTQDPDHDFLIRPTMQKVTIEEMAIVIPNLKTPSAMGYQDPEKSSEIYNSVQRYLTLWLDIINETPEFYHPPVDELYKLESVAQWAYTMHAVQRIRDEAASGQLVDGTVAHPLLQIMNGVHKGLRVEDEGPSFVSHLDDRLPKQLQVMRTNAIDEIMDWEMPELQHSFLL